MVFTAVQDAPLRNTGQIKLHSEEHFAGMRKAGQIAAGCLDMLTEHVKEGVTTEHLDNLAREYALDHGATPACIFYRGYRHTVCTSINHVVCHGIPAARALRPGDIVNIDVTVIVDGWHGDTSRMYAVPPVKRKAMRLMDLTYSAMQAGMEAARVGNHLGDIGASIQNMVEAERCSVVRDFCGHGVGRVFHDAPNILHFGRPGDGPALRAGMFFTIEPMVNLGKAAVGILPDGWTSVTRDRSLSAQYEHSVGITETGLEVFTKSPAGIDQPHKLAAVEG
ncbi:MAG: type I methionyl aminopeptidase [Caulobacterales bacterium]